MFNSSGHATNSRTSRNNVMASTSDLFEGTLLRKHADAAATVLIPIDDHLATVLSGRLP